MYTVNENLQALRSQHTITDALLTLMKLYPYQEITITQICQEGKVVRQTYYRNFESKNDILEFLLDNMFQQYLTNFYYKDADSYNQLKDFFEFMLSNKEFLTLIEKNDLFFMINKAITVNISRFLNLPQLTTIKEQELETYVLGFIASTICSILSLWAVNGFMESPDLLANMTQLFLSGLNNNSNSQ